MLIPEFRSGDALQRLNMHLRSQSFLAFADFSCGQFAFFRLLKLAKATAPKPAINNTATNAFFIMDDLDTKDTLNPAANALILTNGQWPRSEAGQLHFHPPVFCPSCCSLIISNRFGFAIAGSIGSSFGNTFTNQVIFYSFCTAIG